MRLSPPVARIVAGLILTALVAFPAGATTLIRQGLEKLTAENESVVHGRVLDIHSYWNADHTMIMTDIRVLPNQVLKGDRAAREITFTLLGGTVGDITTLIIGGPELVPGSEYVLFLNHEVLQGARPVLTVRDLAQGAFEIADLGKGPRAYSQALNHALLPDLEGLSEPPGGAEGLTVDDLVKQVRQLAGDR
ncbi:MAG TPA: hypothetical protein VJY35_13530 [Candidatus Eisenbacteria bacterium]|nr:hypothetical protein [Candidatus Eisenbacteria bacterium]